MEGKRRKKTHPLGRRLPSPLHIQRELVPSFFMVAESVVAFGIKTTAVETNQTDIDPKGTILQTQRVTIATEIEGS